MSADNAMTKGERTDLCALIRRREKYEKTQVQQRRAELLADFELQLGTIHSWDSNETWAAAHSAAEKAVEQANAEIKASLASLGIPRNFGPGIALNWYGRGENASASRRAELRRMAETRLDAMEKQARTQIERRSIELQEAVIVPGLTSDAAKLFIAEMPKAEALMARLDATAFLKIAPAHQHEPDEDVVIDD